MTPVFIALEVSKSKILLGAFRTDNIEDRKPFARHTIPNRNRGYREALHWIESLDLDKSDIVIGAEGEYGYLGLFGQVLVETGYRFIALKPYLVKEHRCALGFNDKTDGIDLIVIASLMRLKHKDSPSPKSAAHHAEQSQAARGRVLERITREITRHITRMQSLLHAYWPELVCDDDCPELDTYTMLAVLSRWPSPRALLQASSTSITAVIKKASRKTKGAETTRVLQALAREVEFESSQTEGIAREVSMIAKLLETLMRERAQLEKELKAELEQDEIGRKLLSLPHVGVRTVAGLYAAMLPASEIKSEAALARLLGVAPQREQSGRSDRHRALPACRRYGKHALMAYASRLSQLDPESHRFVARKRAAGKTYWRAIKALARYLVRQLWRIIQSATTQRQPLRNAA